MGGPGIMSGLGLRSPAFVGILTASGGGGGGATVPSAPVLTGSFSYTEEGEDNYNLSWTTPANGGSAITGFQLQISSDNSLWNSSQSGGNGFTNSIVTINVGTVRYFRVFAVNAIGNGLVSNVYTANSSS